MAKDPQGQDTLDIVDKSYVITDQAGKELRLELRDDTKVLNRVIPGTRLKLRSHSKAILSRSHDSSHNSRAG
jgi:hypothetical protein